MRNVSGRFALVTLFAYDMTALELVDVLEKNRITLRIPAGKV